MKKALATIRTDELRGCPFSLPISIACKSVGIAIDQMQSLDEVPAEQREKYAKSNRKIYRHSMTGERCKFADKIVEGKDQNIVNCDYGDNGAGERDFPLNPSPYYPRLFGNMGQTGMYSYPPSAYADYGPATQIFDGIYQSYANIGELGIEKAADLYNNKSYYEFKDSILLDEPFGG